MQLKVLNLVAMSLVGASLLAASASNADRQSSDLAGVISKAKAGNRLTPSQKVVIDNLEAYERAFKGCSFSMAYLTGPGAGSPAISRAPSWLVQAAKSVFVDNVEFSPSEIAIIKHHNFDLKVKFDLDRSANEQLGSMSDRVRRAVLDYSPLQTPWAVDVQIGVSKVSINRKPGKNAFSFKLRLEYGHGHIQELNIQDAPIGQEDVNIASANLISAAIGHSRILESITDLKRETNAFRYNLLKLMRVTHGEFEGPLAELASQLLYVSKSHPFTGQATIMGTGFLRYLSAKHDFLEMSQEVQKRQATAGRKSNSAPNFIARRSQGVPTRSTSLGYYTPAVRSRYLQRHPYRPSEDVPDDEIYPLTTWLWLSDPSFMMTHPLFWGVANRNPLNALIYFELLADSSLSNYDNSDVFTSNDSYPPDMSVFDNPIDPIYTAGTSQPVVNPWSDQAVNVPDQVVPAMNQDGVSWQGPSGTIDVRPQDTETLGREWSSFAPPSKTDDYTPAVLTPEETHRSETGDGSGWQATPQPSEDNTRDSSIPSS